MTCGRISTKREAAIQRALQLSLEAMDLMDAHQGPPEASAHLAMAAQELRQEIAKPKS